ncbi:putative uncharacterized protein DDB_G0279653 [Episyrphus balteatus]|uniref:putative uncharacterized protein DDB_G0279653 n=1 Tax=Episyrphus balteatus TaxID=286459 RepID=UPI0024860BFB|nr:putative uncharacterized protein DDB_G0279653 [Episyrphus balteatus]
MGSNGGSENVPPDKKDKNHICLPSQMIDEQEKSRIRQNVDFWTYGDQQINNQRLSLTEMMDISHSGGVKETEIVSSNSNRKSQTPNGSVVIGTPNSTVNGAACPSEFFTKETQTQLKKLLANDRENFTKIMRKRHQVTSFRSSKKIAVHDTNRENRYAILDTDDDVEAPAQKLNAPINANNMASNNTGTNSSHNTYLLANGTTISSGNISNTGNINNNMVNNSNNRKVETGSWCPPIFTKVLEYRTCAYFVVRVWDGKKVDFGGVYDKLILDKNLDNLKTKIDVTILTT